LGIRLQARSKSLAAQIFELGLIFDEQNLREETTSYTFLEIEEALFKAHLIKKL